HAVVHCYNHRGQHAATGIGDKGNAIEITLGSLVRGMRGVIGKVKKKWLARMTSDKRLCLPREGIGEIRALSNLPLSPQQDGVEVFGRSIQKTEKLIESPLERMKVQSRAQMPFADRSTYVTGGF